MYTSEKDFALRRDQIGKASSSHHHPAVAQNLVKARRRQTVAVQVRGVATNPAVATCAWCIPSSISQRSASSGQGLEGLITWVECGDERRVGRLVLPHERRGQLVREARSHGGHTERRAGRIDALSTAGSMSAAATNRRQRKWVLTTLMPMAPALASRGIVARVSDGTSRWLSTVGGAAELARARAAVMLTPNSNIEASSTSGSALKAADACSLVSESLRPASNAGRLGAYGRRA